MEVFIFSQDEQPLTVITAETGLIEAPYRIEINSVPTEPFSFVVNAQHPTSKHVKEENKVVFRDHEGDYRLFIIKRLKDSSDISGSKTRAVCLPVYHAELNDHVIEERRFIDQLVDVAMEAAVQGTRWQAVVEVELGRATTNFYRIFSTEALEDIIATWGGEIKDVVTFDERTNRITGCYLKLIQRHGKEHGQRMEIGHNVVEIEREVLSYPKTALYGFGSSLEVEDEDGEHTGGYTRYIDFADVEWKVSNGDPVDKPLGQEWVGTDEDRLAMGHYDEDGNLKHRFGIFSNQDYEDPEDLLLATWEALQKANKPEVNYRLSVQLFDEKVRLGDTCQAIDRKFARPIEIQARVIAMEYDLMDIEGTMVVEMGQFLDLGDDIDDLRKEIEDVKNNPPRHRIDENSYPNRKPSTPVNLEAYGGMEVIQLYWQYADEMFIKHYEVYGSRTEDFVPDTQHLLWRGDVSAFAHTVGTDEVWYYRVRAVNYHGRPSDWSVQVRAATHRVDTEDIMWGPELAERMRELHRISDIIGENGVDFDQISEEAKDLINQQARIYTDKEIQITREDVMRDISEIADDLEFIDGQLVDKVNVGDVYTIENIDDMFENTVSITTYETDKKGIVKDLEHQESLIRQNEREILNRVTETEFNEESRFLRETIAEVGVYAWGVQQTVSDIRIGGRNLLRYTDFSNEDNFNRLVFWDTYYSTLISNVDGESFGRFWSGSNNQGNETKLRTPYQTLSISKGNDYIFSFKGIQNYSGVYPKQIWVLVNGDTNYGVDFEREEIGVTSNGNTIYRYTAPFTHSRDTNEIAIQITFAIGTNYSQSFDFNNFQLEKGNKVTDWTPAPEDMENRMTIAESSITQLADDITLKVNVDEIVSEINVNREGIRLSGALIHLNGLSLIDEAIIQNAHIADGTIERAKLGRAIIGTAQVENGAITNAKIASLNADKINAANLQAISANMGTLRSGRLLSNNNNMDLNLNTGNLTMRNADFSLGNGAMIRFTNRNNRLLYRNNGISAGIQFDHSLGTNGNPMIGIGVSDGSHSVNDSTFRGLRIHSLGTEGSEGYGVNAISQNFGIYSLADRSGSGYIFRLHALSGRRGIFPQNTGSYNYDLGRYLNRWDRVYADSIRTGGSEGALIITNGGSANGGYRFDTFPQNDGYNTTFRPINSHENNYNIGNGLHRWSYIYLKNSPNISSDKRLKEDIQTLDLGLDFIKDLQPKQFRLKATQADLNHGITKNEVQYGVVAQDLISVLGDRATGLSLVNQSEDGMYGVQYEQLIAPTIRAVQEIDAKLEEEINWQRIEYQALKNKVTKMEDRIKQLEESAA
ncbi:phage tail spike protein [Oceanobacillus sp. FSL W7-1293]|uniref:phage tail spike protein n=1 Tax=Oceanobacillus sp. FSL W7-1293 TaxID=2921699 RepID=UPI0030D006FB